MKTYRLIAVTIITAFVSSAKVYSQSAKVDSIVNETAKLYMQSPSFVGVSIGIYKDGKCYIYNFGEAHKGRHDVPTAKTLYEIASITKTFTGTVLAKAVLERRLKLNDDIRKYLVGSYPNLEYNGRPITIAQLLNHHSGLPFWLPEDTIYSNGTNQALVNRWTELFKHYTRADFYRDLRKVKLDTVPGYKFRYSNAAAMLCGYILEKRYGISFEKLLKQKITGPLQMTNTRMAWHTGDARYMAAGYDENGVLMPLAPNQGQGAGAIKTNVNDMLKYIAWHLDESHEAAKLSHQATWRSGNYWAGLNWQAIQAENGHRLIWQSGDLAGFTSYCVLYPEDQMGIVVLTNEEDHKAAGRIERLINPIAAALVPGALGLP